MAPLDSPIIVLGAARSGTTLLGGTVLGSHPDVAYWPEPSHVWRYGAAYRRHDCRLPEDATRRVTDYIRSRFHEFVERSPGTRFAEKTPGNCFRMPFVLQVLPDARVIHVLRDGRDVILSSSREWTGRSLPRIEGSRQPVGGPRRILRILSNQKGQLRSRVADLRSLLELPADSGRLVRVVRRHLFHSSTLPWGPVFPGLRQIRRVYSLIETCAIQWDLSVRWARSGTARLPDSRYMEIRYEDLVSNPREVSDRVLAFASLSRNETLLDRIAAKIDRRSVRKWATELDSRDLARVENLIGATLTDLGYPLSVRVAASAASPSQVVGTDAISGGVDLFDQEKPSES